MPTYDYVCKKCQHKFEEFQSITADLLTVCPKCSGELKRLIGSGLGIVFKGSGFYETDFKNKKRETPKTNCTDCPNSSTCNESK